MKIKQKRQLIFIQISCLNISGIKSAHFLCHRQHSLIRVFVHAPIEYRNGRVIEVYGDSLSEAKRNIRKSDKVRAAYYKHIQGQCWGNAKHYDLMVDSSFGVYKAVDIIMQYIAPLNHEFFSD